jgi:hypothetical protein
MRPLSKTGLAGGVRPAKPALESYPKEVTLRSGQVPNGIFRQSKYLQPGQINHPLFRSTKTKFAAQWTRNAITLSSAAKYFARFHTFFARSSHGLGLAPPSCTFQAFKKPQAIHNIDFNNSGLAFFQAILASILR